MFDTLEYCCRFYIIITLNDAQCSILPILRAKNQFFEMQLMRKIINCEGKYMKFINFTFRSHIYIFFLSCEQISIGKVKLDWSTEYFIFIFMLNFEPAYFTTIFLRKLLVLNPEVQFCFVKVHIYTFTMHRQKCNLDFICDESYSVGESSDG